MQSLTGQILVQKFQALDMGKEKANLSQTLVYKDQTTLWNIVADRHINKLKGTQV